MKNILRLRDLFHGSQDPSRDLFYEVCKVVDEDPAPEVLQYAQDHLNTWENQELRVDMVCFPKPYQSLVRVLNLWNYEIGESGMAAIAASPYLKDVKVVF